MTSYWVSPNLPRDPSGMVGLVCVLPSNFWRIWTSGVDASSTVKHCGQTTLSVWANPRNSTGPPQLGHEIDLACTAAISSSPQIREDSLGADRQTRRRAPETEAEGS